MLSVGPVVARSVRANSCYYVIRSLHTSSSRSDLFSFFRKTKVPMEPGKELKPTKPQKTSEVMKELVSDKKDKKRSNLRIIGAPPADDSWELENNGFQVNAWPVTTVAPKLTSQQVDEALKNAYDTVIGENTQVSLSERSLLDLNTRFNFIKHVNKDLKVAMPDSEVNNVNVIGDVEKYYKKRVIDKEYNEWEPEAIYLKQEDFEGYNVTIIDAQADRAKRREKRASLLREAKKSEYDRQRELLDKAFD